MPFRDIKRRLESAVKRSFDENIPKVTILTVVKNAEATISRTISAVRSQTYRNIEYIVIDGLSDDDTCTIIKQNQDCISYWNSQADSGPADATNLAISLATGKFIFWFCADDFVDPEFVEHGVDCLLKNGASFVYGDLKRIKNGVEQKTVFADQ
ncbi:glycosyltransferase, partial [SAR116 cluster bacterium]|nr:glycosyltransferase [SAR116 cluster bacterium]